MKYSYNRERAARVTQQIAGEIQARIRSVQPELRRIELEAGFAKQPGMRRRPSSDTEITKVCKVPRALREQSRRTPPIGVAFEPMKVPRVTPVRSPLQCFCGAPKHWSAQECDLCADVEREFAAATVPTVPGRGKR